MERPSRAPPAGRRRPVMAAHEVEARDLFARRVDEFADEACDGVGALHLGLMADTGNDVKHAARNRVVRRVRVRDGDAAVLVAEDDHGGQIRTQPVRCCAAAWPRWSATERNVRRNAARLCRFDNAASPFNVSLYLVAPRPEDSARCEAPCHLDRGRRCNHRARALNREATSCAAQAHIASEPAAADQNDPRQYSCADGRTVRRPRHRTSDR